MFGIIVHLQRRGGSTISTDPNDPSSYPTTPPASTQTHFRSVPEIGGSEGGFIGLVIGLAIIFVGSCIGVFFLLRNWKHGGRTVPGKSGEIGKEPPPSSGFPRRRGTLFGFRSKNPKQAGWVRAPGEDEDDWDANDTLGTGPYDPAPGHGTNYESEPVKLDRSMHGGNNGLRGEVTVPNLGYSHERQRDGSEIDLHAPNRQPEDDPFYPPPRSTSPNTMVDDSLSHYPAYIDHLNMRNDSQPRHMSVDSAETVFTFPGGTKFKEDL
ncbi:uncharacterized protein FOMMEDRAFT_18408 [Fomitiporia mediterranea MF3/22]|uniref:uncharacterized protein n=1 Tax=Fomitiporia mediterranea (strain MF3/22) TaxID=694068 RepID=UPI0004407294|nr:uncharacterized protein FOMMEDRAFT_18408 [Fomitiporia mediterranea MF3/22]EJD06263.1 hypothetical protein FOMMEDRAFT_18408 [Fomitiporia mediterranea MF3/22]